MIFFNRRCFMKKSDVALAELLFKDTKKTIEDYETKYPKRNLPDDALVTRFAPSPTGFVHMGSLYAAFLSQQLAKQTDGIFFLRIEDTDHKREVENGISAIITDLEKFRITPNEGPNNLGGSYGPYIQSERKEIYHTFAKYLVAKGLAYPCFCTKEELDELRTNQELEKRRTGYYKEFARCRSLSLEEIKTKLEQNIPYVIRLKSTGSFDEKIEVEDCIKGKVTFPKNDMDIVLLKQDGLPTYHFAHVVDDYLMHTNLVVRGDEWLPSLPVHLELFSHLGKRPPKYAHLAPLQKKEGTSVRKLSKRYDKECSLKFYFEEGYPILAVKLYLATILNSNFEEWYQATKDNNIDHFTFQFSKMATGGSLFDLEKLENISKTYFSLKKAEDLYDEIVMYYDLYDLEFSQLLKMYRDETIAFLNIEREGPRPRRDIAKYKDVKKEFSYFFDELFLKEHPYRDVTINKKDLTLTEEYIKTCYNDQDSEEEWLSKLKEHALKYDYADSVKKYKENKENYQGHFGDVCTKLRIIVTGRTNTPNIYHILKILGKKRMEERLEFFKKETNFVEQTQDLC